MLVTTKFLDYQELYDITILFISIGVFYLLKIFGIKIFGRIFMLKGLANIGVFFSLLFDRATGVIIFPLVVVLYFFHFEITQAVLLLIAILFFVMMILKCFWLWKIGVKSFGLSSFYIFLYLCTLEISPLLLFFEEVIF